MKFRIKQARQGRIVAFSGAFSSMLDEYGLKDTVILGKLKSGWKNIAGALLAVHSSPDKLFRNILFISVDHPIYSNELSLMKEIIVSKINEEYGSQVVRDIRLQVAKKRYKGR